MNGRVSDVVGLHGAHCGRRVRQIRSCFLWIQTAARLKMRSFWSMKCGGLPESGISLS